MLRLLQEYPSVFFPFCFVRLELRWADHRSEFDSDLTATGHRWHKADAKEIRGMYRRRLDILKPKSRANDR